MHYLEVTVGVKMEENYFISIIKINYYRRRDVNLKQQMSLERFATIDFVKKVIIKTLMPWCLIW